MKFVSALFTLCCLYFSGYGQTVLLSPTGAGGFETGGTLVSNGWVAVNPTPASNNQWVVGGAAGSFAGSNSVFISNNGGVSYAYNTSAASTAHFYRDLVIPPGSVSITLSFQWKGFGEPGADRMLIYTAPTSLTPVVNVPASPSTSMPGATLVWTQPNATTAAFTPETIALPSSLAGTTVRLIFTWQTDANLGTSPGGAIDNISFTYVCSAPEPIAGTLSLCTGTTTTLSDPSPAGAWSSSTAAVGTISSSGVVTALTGGTTTVSYSVTGCLSPATAVVTVMAAPAAITGPSIVCLGSTISLGETSLGGTWASSAPATASVDVSGNVIGLALGTATITFSNGCGAAVTKVVSVNPLPPAITATVMHVCAGGGMITMTDASTGGTWSASPATNATAATTGPGTGTITGISGGTATVTYTSALGCPATIDITVDPLPPAISGVAPICAGSFITLADALPGGTWSSSVPGVATIGSSSGFVVGIAGGTTVISYTNACGSATAIFTVNAYPGPIVGDDSLCIGQTTTYANPLIGGTWSSSNPGVCTILPTSGFTTALAVGTTYITYTMPGGCSISRLVAVLNPPPPITGVMHLCPDATTHLLIAVGGGTWSSANPVVGTVDATGTVTGIAADTVHIVYTTHAGCTTYANVTVDPFPAPIVGNPVLCNLQSTTLFDASPGGTWSSLAISVATIGSSTGVVVPLAVGTATFKYTLPTGCSTTRSFNVKSVPVPPIAFNNTTNRIYTDAGFDTYEWHHSVAGIIPGATTNSTPGLLNGDYYVVVTDHDGCIGTSARFAYNLSMAVSQGRYSGITIYPNPAKNIVNVYAPVSVRAVISGVDGRAEMVLDNVAQIDISSLPPGIHIISLYDDYGNRVLLDKLVKQ